MSFHAPPRVHSFTKQLQDQIHRILHSIGIWDEESAARMNPETLEMYRCLAIVRSLPAGDGLRYFLFRQLDEDAAALKIVDPNNPSLIARLQGQAARSQAILDALEKASEIVNLAEENNPNQKEKQNGG